MNIASNGIRIHVEDEGEGALAIVFLHSWGGSTRECTGRLCDHSVRLLSLLVR